MIATLMVATSGLIYELLAGTLCSYLKGDSVYYFSTIVGTYMFAMGVGSWLAKFIPRGLLKAFIWVQLLLALSGGLLTTFLMYCYTSGWPFLPCLYASVMWVGLLVGTEIPLVMRILEPESEFSDLVSKVLSFDYIGALLASVAFPLLLIPQLGVFRTGYLFGLVNLVVAFSLISLLKSKYDRVLLFAWGAIVGVILIGAWVYTDTFTQWSEKQLLGGQVLHSVESPYQKIVVTADGSFIELYLNNHLQFSTFDEYRYHEALVAPALSQVGEVHNVLICGGGDGLAVRDVLRFAPKAKVTLVELDKAVTDLFCSPELAQLNEGALLDPRVTIVNTDAFHWVRTNSEFYDVIVVDFPDPNDYGVGKLYTTTFYQNLKTLLKPSGALVVQASSPFVGRKAYWCEVHTMEAAGLTCYPYHVQVPSFGAWGYVLAFPDDRPLAPLAQQDYRFLTQDYFTASLVFPKDMQELETGVNQLFDQVLVQYFRQDWQAH